jgi:peptide/nickel transport system ATP-binding protein
MAPTLQVRDLVIELTTPDARVPIVNGVSFSVDAGETFAIVGESGCGKSMTALSLLKILPEPNVSIANGKIVLEGVDLTAASERKMRKVRSKEMSIIFQEPLTSLNPVHTVGNQIIEVIRSHRAVSYADARRQAITLLEHVRIPDAERRINEYPHRLSGGMCQRVMIAMALACNPKVLIADEPTTALDTTVQAQVIALLTKAQEEYGTAIILITHNLALAAEAADRIAVMYAGKIVEQGDTAEVLYRPRHPYTIGLLGAIPRDGDAAGNVPHRLMEIKGTVPSPGGLPAGCAFAARCERVQEICRVQEPALLSVEREHKVACFAVTEKVR